MASIFSVKFSDDETLVIDDIIDFHISQKAELVRITSEYTKTELRNAEDEGKDLSSLTTQQRLTVVSKKNSLVKEKQLMSCVKKEKS